MPQDPIVYEIYQSFNRDNELPYDDMISYIMLHYEVSEANAIRLYKEAEKLYDLFIEQKWILDSAKWTWTKTSLKI